ncbi:MAG: NYN domain-containing protein [Candidatus Brocadiia bacterium]
MHVIVDGYNLLFATGSHRQGGPEGVEQGRERLLDLLVRYARVEGHEITVVFDSSRHTGGAATQQRRPGLRVLVSHPPRTADDDILRLVRAAGSRGTRVVTSDRELADACARCGARVVGAADFHRQLLARTRRAEAEEEELRLKTQPPSDQEVRRWLEAFGESDEA